MVSRDVLDQLWAGRILGYSLSLESNRFDLQVQVVEGDTTSRYHVVCNGIQEFTFKDEDPTDWDYVELTSIEVVHERGGLRLDMELWSAQLRIRCTAVAVELLDRHVAERPNGS
jgi:hypothetical protein